MKLLLPVNCVTLELGTSALELVLKQVMQIFALRLARGI